MRYYDELATYERDGFTVIVDKTWEDCQIRDLFDDSCCDIKDLERKVNSGDLDWFMLRVRVLVEGLEIADQMVGGCLYADPKEVLTDGLAEDLIGEALIEAKRDVYRLSKKFAELSDMVDSEGVNV
jgi:hypothetical protein